MSTVDASTLFAKTAAGRAAIAEAEAERESERQRHASEIERLEAASKASRPDLTKALAAADAKYKKAKTALQKARRNLRLSQVTLYSHDSRVAKAIEPHEAALLASADPAIDEFVSELDKLVDETRRATVQTRTEMNHDVLGRERPGKTFSTYAAICRRLDAIREARAIALSLKMKVGIDVAAEIARLRDGITKIDINEYSEV